MRLDELSVEHHTVDVGGLRMHYVAKGQGPLVLLLHGFPELWWSWRYQIDAIADAGFRVVAPDLRGYNETDKQGPYDMDTLADDVRALIASLGERAAHIVGHDWGGALAWHVASVMPHAVHKLAVINCPHPAVMQRVIFSGNWRQIRKSWYMFFFQLPWLPERTLAANGGANLRKLYHAHAIDSTHFGDDELAPFVQNILRPGAARAMVGWYRAVFATALRAARTGMFYRQITAPTLLLWGLQDRALGFEDLVPGTERHVDKLRVEPIATGGHFVHAERPELVNPLLLEFLQRDAPAQSVAGRTL
jgi:pimeloyl-ACP methyl ester carboxylesterase